MAERRVDIFDMDRLPLRIRMFYEKNRYMVDKRANPLATNAVFRVIKALGRRNMAKSRFIYSPTLDRPVIISEFEESNNFMDYDCVNCGDPCKSDIRVVSIENIQCAKCRGSYVDPKKSMNFIENFVYACRTRLEESHIMILKLMNDYNSQT